MRRACTAVVLAATLTGCGGGKPAASQSQSPIAATESPTPSASQAPSPTATPTPSATALPTDLTDGKHYVFAKSIDTAKYTIVVDVVQFLTGQQAQDAAKADGKEADNDYYIRNGNTRLRTLTFDPAMPIVVNTLTAEESGDAAKDTTITLPKFGAYFDAGEAQDRLYILTIAKGRVVDVHEQYLP
jgi:hypothetical protein